MTEKKSSDSIITIDCNYLYPKFAAAYLIIEGDMAAFVDNNTIYAVPRLLSSLRENNIKPEELKYIIVTHLHLDHAGGTSALAKECPNAVILAHERAARHIIDPSRLIKGATAVYGESKFNRLYGKIEAVEQGRVRIVEDGEIIDFGERRFTFIYTPGHAKHHISIYDSRSNGIFTGDSLGLAYPILQAGRESFVFPSTTPTDFDPDEAMISIDKILNTKAGTAFLTHFGPIRDIKGAAAMMKDYLIVMSNIITDAINQDLEGNVLKNFCIDKITEFLRDEIENRGLTFSSEIQEFLKMDIELNSGGIAAAVQKM